MSSLQDNFAAFRERKQKQVQHKKYLSTLKSPIVRTPEFKNNLRQQFVEQCKKYIGVPYHKRYHEPGDEFHDAPLYLDCCALVRQAVQDLKDQFGFELLRYNQAYQYDVLPIDLKLEEMQPGDLVFISGTYFNEKSKKQLHDLVHVEIYLGEEKTIGARIQKGTIQIFDSYAFVSKTYYNMKYYFKSIDTWLDGVCKQAIYFRSYCEQHKWHENDINWIPDKYSIFASEDEELDINGKKIAQIGKGNNDKLIRKYFEKLDNWMVIDSTNFGHQRYDYKWVQNVSDIDFFTFKEGEQVVCHIPNISQVLTTKKVFYINQSLNATLHEYDNSCYNDFKYKSTKFYQKTFDLTQTSDLNDFLKQELQGIWIKKPTNKNQGIEIIQDINAFAQQIKELMKDEGNCVERNFIIQQYMENPLLINKRKFDIRCYMIIASTKPYLVLYREGYLRLSINAYDKNNEDIFTHLTNNAIQKKHPDYQSQKEDLIWGMDQFQQYMKKVDIDFEYEVFDKKIQEIMLYVFKATEKKLQKKTGQYELLGFDFIVNNEYEPILIEINTNPALFTDVKNLERAIKPVVYDTLDLILELNKLNSGTNKEFILSKFDIIYDAQHKKNNQ